MYVCVKLRQTNTKCYRVIQLRSVSIQQKGLKEEVLTKIKSDIGEFSHLVGVCGNKFFVTNLLVESVFGKKNAVFHVFGCFKFKVTFRFSCLLV